MNNARCLADYNRPSVYTLVSYVRWTGSERGRIARVAWADAWCTL